MKKFEFSAEQFSLLPSNPVDLKAIKAAIVEMSGAMTRIEGERSFIKEASADISEKFEVEKKLIGKLLRAYHKSNKEEVIAEATDLDSAYDTLFSTTKAE